MKPLEKFRYLYVVVDALDKDKRVEEGSLLFWDYHGKYYTITLYDMETRDIKPFANIVLLKKLSQEEVDCVYVEEKTPCHCIHGFPELVRERLRQAYKSKSGFPHIYKKLDKLVDSTLRVARCIQPEEEVASRG